jgi:meiotically up-regulated gene 157 (Mug157) protein
MNELKQLVLDSHKASGIALAQEIEAGIEKFALINGIYAYEVDGLGNALFIDDANVPSLLSLPYLEVLPASDPNYLQTREFILS